MLVLAFALAGCGGGDAAPVSASASAPGGGGGGGSGGTTPPSSGDTTPPTSPANLSATTDGPFGAIVSWQASSDNVGVARYRVERCQGAGCSTFTEVAAPTGTSFTDTGLAATTSYSYRVRATDAAANLSSFSSLANVTTAIAPPPPLLNLPAWVASLAPGQWFEIPNTAIASVEPSPIPAGTNRDSKVIAWTSFVVDTRTSKVYSLANGGHNNYAGNEVDMLDLEAPVPAWRELIPPTPSAQVTGCQSYYADGRPTSRHSYYGITLNEFNDRIMLFAGAHWCQGGGFHSAISSYNITANTWSPSNTHGSVPGVISAGVAAYTLNPLTGDVYASLGGSFGRWNRASGPNGTFTTLNPTGSAPAGEESASAMDTTRPPGANPIGRILIVGGNNNDRHLYTISTNSFTAITLNGANAANISGADKAGMAYVEAIDRYLMRLGGAGGAVYGINPSTFEVTAFATTNGASIPSTQSGPYNKFRYVPRLRGFIYVPSYSGNAWFLRVH